MLLKAFHPVIIQLFRKINTPWCDVFSKNTMMVFIIPKSNIEHPQKQWHNSCQYFIWIDTSEYRIYKYDIVSCPNNEVKQHNEMNSDNKQQFINKIIQIHNDSYTKY